jgi:hypothetical protein
MTDLELMRARLPVLYKLNRRNRMLRVNEPNGAAAPRFFLGRTAKGLEWRFREDVDEATADAMSAVCRTEPLGAALSPLPSGADRYRDFLGVAGRQWAGPAYRFPALQPLVSDAVAITGDNATLLQEDFPDWVADVPLRQPFMALMIESKVVSVCCSVRIGALVHEAGVETHALWRGRGCAAQVTAAWAAAVWATWGAHPVYSTAWENAASQAVAKRLRLVQFGVDFDLM